MGCTKALPEQFALITRRFSLSPASTSALQSYYKFIKKHCFNIEKAFYSLLFQNL
ncbi:hypothetical protein HMPREF1870_00602 [Bacteroidales bacterium KA00344]|nr:hypothetical protein HMPREF1870_00602 [Bacteroidales bacterium KA00344]